MESALTEPSLGQRCGLNELVKTRNRNCLTLPSVPQNSPQHSQCWLSHSVGFSQEAVHHLDHSCCFSPLVFTKQVMLSSSHCCLKRAKCMVCDSYFLKHSKLAPNQVLSVPNMIRTAAILFKPERLNLFVPLNTSQQCAPARKAKSTLAALAAA